MPANELKYLSLLIIILPFLSWIVTGIWGNRFDRRTIVSLAISCVSGSLFLGALLSAKFLNTSDPVTFTFSKWFATGGLKVWMGLQIDNLSLIMVLAVTLVGILVLIYSASYPEKSTSGARFYSLVSFSIASMLLLVMADNFLLMLIGWEGVAISSSLLIGLDYTNDSANGAARVLYISNRVANTALIAGIVLLAASPLALHPNGIIRGLEYNLIFGNIDNLLQTDPGYITAMLPLLTIISILFIIGAAGKSAQLFFNIWLPEANAAPAGASALIQTVTMVAAGVYFLVRIHPLLLLTPVIMAIITIIGAISVIYAGIVASVQTDIRKILAWSTISQVGYMFLGCGVGAFIPVVFHLITHAVTKAALVLASGAVIRGSQGESDLRKLGGLKKWMPATRMNFLLASASLAGFPLTAMFLS
jgi:NADH-quinone oxidoreductase subunit L